MPVLQDYRYDNTNRFQKCLFFGSILIAGHFAFGLSLWLLLIGVEIARLQNGSMFHQPITSWMPFFSRIWKCTFPLVLTALAFSQIPRRPKVAAWLLAGILVFSIICFGIDVATRQYDLTTFGEESHAYFFTWWWYRG